MADERKWVTAEPENSETPIESLASWVTPSRLFFVRNHFDPPAIDLKTWRLSVEGLVGSKRQWTWAELNEMPQRTVFATVECAGNGRSFLHPHAAGVQWGAGAIGHAEWTGIPLRDVLKASGLDPAATEVVCVGADEGCEADHPIPMHFARSLPVSKALHPDTLLALRMNGELLEAVHGYPLRLFVPGWYGVASVKWLNRIVAIDRPFQGYFQTAKYTIDRRVGNATKRVVVGPMVVKSEILRPRPGETLGIGTNRIFGLAWAGEQAIARVEVSTDGGAIWTQAQIVGPRAAYSWCLWEFLWEVGTAGSYALLARAVSESGDVQPTEHDPLLGGYVITHSRPTNVEVAPTRRSHVAQSDADALVYDMNAFAEENARLPLDLDLEYAAGGGI
jgi:DMSO/TMAO reductase YedYZ molybdopterin-dependent catalytic subunit